MRGSARSVLLGERIALNFMQRMSGIATATRAMVLAVKVPPALHPCELQAPAVHQGCRLLSFRARGRCPVVNGGAGLMHVCMWLYCSSAGFLLLLQRRR